MTSPGPVVLCECGKAVDPSDAASGCPLCLECLWGPLPVCTCEGEHDDEAECERNPECTCGPVYFHIYCPRHGDPGANSPV